MWLCSETGQSGCCYQSKKKCYSSLKIVDSWGGVVVAVSHYTTHDDDHHEMILFSRTMHRIYFKEIAEFQYYGSPLLFFFTSRDISTECVNKLFQSLGSFNSPNFSELWNLIISPNLGRAEPHLTKLHLTCLSFRILLSTLLKSLLKHPVGDF